MDIRKIVHDKNLTALEYSILEFILQDITHSIRIGVRGIASENYTSSATIMRLSKKMGYNGFTEMVYSLKRNAEAQSVSTTRIEEAYTPLTSLLNSNQLETLTEVSKILHNTKHSIFINATGFSGIVGQYFYKKLLVRGNNVVIMNSGDSIAVLEQRLKSIKYFLAISKSGLTPDIVEKARKAKEAGITVITFTSTLDCELSKLSDYRIILESGINLDDRNKMTNFFFSEAILAFEYILSL